MLINPFRRLERLLAPAPEERGQVISAAAGHVVVELPTGVRIRARGTATVGAYVAVRGGAIIGDSPAMSGTEIDV